MTPKPKPRRRHPASRQSRPKPRLRADEEDPFETMPDRFQLALAPQKRHEAGDAYMSIFLSRVPIPRTCDQAFPHLPVKRGPHRRTSDDGN